MLSGEEGDELPRRLRMGYGSSLDWTTEGGTGIVAARKAAPSQLRDHNDHVRDGAILMTEKGITPLDYMLQRLRDDALDPDARFEAAKAAAPYVHPKLANVEHGGKLVTMYAKEYEDFRRSLFTPGENEVMWGSLGILLA